MAFKADAAKIKRWREERQWSQEHLAELAGLGLRTVQRIEKGEPASQDSMMALASAFDVEVMALSVDVEAEVAALAKGRMSKARAGVHLSFYIHLAGYGVGMVTFLAISLGMGGDSFIMKWPMLWWTVGLAAHGAALGIVEAVARFQRV